ncbi:MAG: serine/threonine-protein kinase [Acidimicrobiales bacterium]
MANGIDLGIDGLGPATMLARGGSAYVYLAEQTDFGRQVAVKVLFNALEDDVTYRRFDRECRAIGAVSHHPNIVVVHGRGLTADERPYLIMEHRSGGSLAESLKRRGRLTEAEAIRIGIDIGTALEVAHQAGVLHRDVKPANILLSSYNQPALADFGIARIEGTHKTTEGVFSASVVHASREVLDGGEPTPQSDVYGLGSTLFELVTGQAAFADPDDSSMWAIVNRVLSRDPPDPRRFGVSDGLATVLSKAMSHDRQTRHSTADELVSDLRSLQSGPGRAGLTTDLLPAVEADTRVAVEPLPDPRHHHDRQRQLSAPIEIDNTAVRAGSISRTALAVGVAVIVVATASIAGFAYRRVGLPQSPIEAAEEPNRADSSNRSSSQGSGSVAEAGDAGGTDEGNGGGGDSLTATPVSSLVLRFDRAEIGPLKSNEPYLLAVAGAFDDGEYRIVVDEEPLTEFEQAVPLFYPPPGRHRMQVEARAGQRSELSNAIEIYVSDRGPEPGYRANLSSIVSEPANWPEALRQFDQMEADGHADLELSLSTRQESDQLPFWNYYVDGFGEDEAAAQAYCDSFDLEFDLCFVAKV